jgi:hypothetical protein
VHRFSQFALGDHERAVVDSICQFAVGNGPVTIGAYQALGDPMHRVFGGRRWRGQSSAFFGTG